MRYWARAIPSDCGKLTLSRPEGEEQVKGYGILASGGRSSGGGAGSILPVQAKADANGRHLEVPEEVSRGKGDLSSPFMQL